MAKNIYEILRKRYPANEYALMQEVSDKAGAYRSRSADWVLMGLWPSRGLTLQGIEQKASRSDWLSELKKPEKAENVFKFCDYWWLFTTEDNVAKLEEIPVTWGWMAIKGDKITVLKEAPKLTPEPISRHFLATLLKRAEDKSGWVRFDSMDETIEQSVETRVGPYKRDLENCRDENRKLTETMNNFQSATGIRLMRWGNPDYSKLIRAINLVSNGNFSQLKSQLQAMQQTANGIADEVKRRLEAFESIPENAKEILTETE